MENEAIVIIRRHIRDLRGDFEGGIPECEREIANSEHILKDRKERLMELKKQFKELQEALGKLEK